MTAQRKPPQSRRTAPNDVCLVGSAMSTLTKYVETPSLEVARLTIAAAIADSGLPREAVRALAVTPPGLAGQSTSMWVARLNEHLGLNLDSVACLENGGMSAALALRWAIFEVESGRVDVAVALGIDQRWPELPQDGETFDSYIERIVHGTMAIYGPNDGLYGLGAPIPYYAMSAQRYMHETGATSTDLAWAAVRLREHANRNPQAMFFDKRLTVDEVLNSPYLCPPLHLADCSQFVTGAAAVVVARREVAATLQSPPVRLRAWGQAHHPSSFAQSTPSITRFPAAERAAALAYEQAGITAADLDVAEVYGVFSSTELMLCEAFGFAPRGQAAAMFRDGAFTYGGQLVVDPSGGRLSLGHPATATPLLATHEIRRQLTGRADARQVADARLALVHAEHGMLNGCAVMIWERSDA